MARPVTCGSVGMLFAGASALLITSIGAAKGAGEEARQDLAQQARGSLTWIAQDLRARSLNGGYTPLYLPLSTPGDITTIGIQYPGTPDVGQCLLRAYDILDHQEFLDGAKEVGRALAWYQSETGGWPIEIEEPTPPPTTDEGMGHISRQKRDDTFDDNATQGALDFLLTLDDRIDAPWLDKALDLGLDFMLEGQLEAGGWPQYYPLIGGYHDFHTFNDGAINNAISVMLKAHEHLDDPRFLGSALRGAAFIAASQLPAPQAGWAQQYDWDLKPAPARPFEPASVSSSSTSRNILTLLEIAKHTGDAQYLQPIPAAIEWLRASALDEKSWARFYELGTNRPIYPTRSGDIVDSLDDLPEDERGKYAYVAGFKVKEAIKLYERLRENPRADDFERWRDEALRAEAKRKTRKSEQRIAEVLAYARQYRAEPASNEILLGEFVELCETVLNYLEFNKIP